MCSLKNPFTGTFVLCLCIKSTGDGCCWHGASCIFPAGNQKCKKEEDGDEIQEAFQVLPNYIVTDLSSAQMAAVQEVMRELFLLCPREEAQPQEKVLVVCRAPQP